MLLPKLSSFEMVIFFWFRPFPYILTLKAPITTAADDKFCDIFSYFRKKGIIFHENRLPADDSHEISCLNFLFLKKSNKILNCRLLQIIGGA